MPSTKITVDETGHLLVKQDGNADIKELYICSLYKVGGFVPYAERWPEGPLKTWVDRWAIVEVESDETYPDSDKRLRGPGLLAVVTRHDEMRRIQGTYKKHQLYTFVGDAGARDNHEVFGFWEKAHLDVEELDEFDGEVPNARGP